MLCGDYRDSPWRFKVNLAKELFEGAIYGRAQDIWSFGFVFSFTVNSGCASAGATNVGGDPV
jgi:hypothetical protein